MVVRQMDHVNVTSGRPTLLNKAVHKELQVHWEAHDCGTGSVAFDIIQAAVLGPASKARVVWKEGRGGRGGGGGEPLKRE